jgi:hypothetical protein
MTTLVESKIATIQRVVGRHYSITRSDLLSHRRMAELVLPRQVAIFLARKLTLHSLPAIGHHFGNRDHTTILHAIRKIEAQLFENASLEEDVKALKRQLLELSCDHAAEPRRITIWLDPRLRQLAEVAAQRQGYTLADFIEACVKAAVASHTAADRIGS